MRCFSDSGVLWSTGIYKYLGRERYNIVPLLYKHTIAENSVGKESFSWQRSVAAKRSVAN